MVLKLPGLQCFIMVLENRVIQEELETGGGVNSRCRACSVVYTEQLQEWHHRLWGRNKVWNPGSTGSRHPGFQMLCCGVWDLKMGRTEGL